MPMGSKSDYLEAAVLNILGGTTPTVPATVYVALFTTLPSDSGGGVEVSGGGYARVAVTNNSTNFPAASGGSKSNGTLIDFGTATLDWGDVIGWGIFDAASSGNLLWWGQLQGARKVFSGLASTDVITSTSHGYADGTKVRVEAIGALSLPTGLAASTTYYVRDSTTNTFKLAATLGGSAIDLTADGVGYIYEWKNQTVNSGNPVSIPISGLTITED